MKKHSKFKTIESCVKPIQTFMLLLGGIGCILISWWLLNWAFKSDGNHTTILIFNILILASGIYCILWIFTPNYRLKLDNEKLICTSVFRVVKQTIYLKDILYYTSINKENEDNRWEELTLYTKKEVLKINSFTYSNYFHFKNKCILGLTKNTDLESMHTYVIIRNYAIGILGFGLLFMFISLNLFLEKYNYIPKEDLSTLQGTVAYCIEIKEKKNTNRIEIKLNEYPDFIFELSGSQFISSQSNAIVSTIKKGDLIQIDLFKALYNKYIIKAYPLNALEQMFTLETISVNGLRTSKHTYLSIDDINKQKRSDSNSLLLFVFISLSLILLGFYVLIDTTQKAIYRYPPNYLGSVKL